MKSVLMSVAILVPALSANAATKVYKCTTLPDQASQRRVVVEVTDAKPLPLMHVYRSDVDCLMYASVVKYKTGENVLKAECNGDGFTLQTDADDQGRFRLNENLTISGRNWTLRHACELGKK